MDELAASRSASAREVHVRLYMADRAQPLAWRIHPQTRSGILVDARDYYRAFYETARQARRSILLLGWQFDSDVPLVRGSDLPRGVAPEDVTLLRFLDGLCAARPELEVRVLAWDHSLWFALEREVLQKLAFDLRTSERFFFETDATVAEYGAHHQKVAIVDGRVGFLGSNDIAQDRWDTSAHRCGDPLRVGRSGQACKPYHEVQAAVTGAAARSLVDLFVERWGDATGEHLAPESLVAPGTELLSTRVTMPMPDAAIGLYRQLPHRLGRAPVREARDLFVDSIRRAERSIYVETQYLTSEVVRDAFVERMRDRRMPKLDIVMVLPQKPEALKEELAIGATQAEVVTELTAEARRNGHALGLYNVCVPHGEGDGTYVYIHSKLMIVDDVKLMIGSANLNNRSMSLDSELVAAWMADAPDAELASAIRGLRVRLLSEHLGAAAEEAGTFDPVGLVARLDAVARSGRSRLRHHDLEGEEPGFLMKIGQKIASAYADPPHCPESRETPLLFDGPAPAHPR